MIQARASDINVRVPAKVMLAGEYAVLSGGRALAVSLDCWLNASLKSRSIPGITVTSNLWSQAQDIKPSADLQCWRQTPLTHAAAISSAAYGIEAATLQITSAIEVSHGIGSSSALRLAVSMAMAEAGQHWPKNQSISQVLQPAQSACGHSLGLAAGAAHSDSSMLNLASQSDWQCARMAVALQRAAQGSASGYDVATQLVGGLVIFTGADALDAWPGSVATLPSQAVDSLSELVQVYVGGTGAATGPLLESTRAWLVANSKWEEFCSRSESLVTAFIQALTQPDAGSDHSRELYRACAAHRQILSAAPQFPKEVASALADIPGVDRDFSWKTTGAGGDDAILLLGPPSHRTRAEAKLRSLGRHPLSLGFTSRGAELTRFDTAGSASSHFCKQPDDERTAAL